MTLRIVDMGGLLCAQNRHHDTLKWWCHPRLMTRKIKRLIHNHPDGWKHYGVWCALVSEITDTKPRDQLVDRDGNDIRLSELAPEWRMTLGELEAIIERLCSDEIGLLCGLTGELEEYSTQPRGKLEIEEKRLEENRREEISLPDSAALSDRDRFVAGWNAIVTEHGQGVPKTRKVSSYTQRLQTMLKRAAEYNPENPWAAITKTVWWFVRQNYVHEDGRLCGVQTFMRTTNYPRYLEEAHS